MAPDCGDGNLSVAAVSMAMRRGVRPATSPIHSNCPRPPPRQHVCEIGEQLSQRQSGRTTRPLPTATSSGPVPSRPKQSGSERREPPSARLRSDEQWKGRSKFNRLWTAPTTHKAIYNPLTCRRGMMTTIDVPTTTGQINTPGVDQKPKTLYSPHAAQQAMIPLPALGPTPNFSSKPARQHRPPHDEQRRPQDHANRDNCARPPTLQPTSALERRQHRHQQQPDGSFTEEPLTRAKTVSRRKISYSMDIPYR